MVIPQAKGVLLGEAQAEVQRVIDQYQEGLITDGERYNKIVDIWAGVADKVTQEMMSEIGKEKIVDPETGKELIEPSFNPIYIMADSGARGSTQQIRQLAAMRGLMAKPSGEIIETPITANFREGLTVLQYFISTHGARKGLADTALKTANSGYLTRRLVDVAQDAVITEFDCGTLDGIRVTKLEDAGEVIQPLGDRILGRVALEDIVDPLTGEVLVAANTELDEHLVHVIEDAGIEEVVIRSVLTCQTKRGVCAKCYGRDLARGYKVNIGEAVGIIASQSIGEPGTQLTMRTFHIGGAAARGKIEQSSLEARNEGYVRIRNANIAKKQDGSIVMNRHGEIVLVDDTGREREHHRLVYGALLKVNEGDKVKAGQLLAEWDAFAVPILSEVGGIVKFGDIVEGVTMTEKLDEVTGLSRKVIIESQRRGSPPAHLDQGPEDGRDAQAAEQHARRALPPAGRREHRRAGRRRASSAGDVIAKIPRETTKTQDITGGLPRVAELFEARKPKDHAIIAEIDGEVSLRQGHEGQAQGRHHARSRRTARCSTDQAREYLIPKGKHIQVQPGDRVRAGEPLDGRAGQPARHPAREGREGAGGVPRQRDPAGLPPAGRRHQRQAHRGHRPPDAPPRPDQGRGRHELPHRRAGREAHLRAGEPARHRARRHARRWPSRCSSASRRRASRPSRSSARAPSRRRPRCSPRRRSPARSTTCAASRRTSSWAGSSRPAPACPRTSSSR